MTDLLFLLFFFAYGVIAFICVAAAAILCTMIGTMLVLEHTIGGAR